MTANGGLTLRDTDFIPGVPERLAFYGGILSLVADLYTHYPPDELPSLSLVAGGMGAGKSGALITVHEHLIRNGLSSQCFRPRLSDRDEGPNIRTRADLAQTELQAHMYDEPEEILAQLSPGTDFIMVDEVQMHTPEQAPRYGGIVRALNSAGVPVIQSGLLLNFGGQPFHIVNVLDELEMQLLILRGKCRRCNGHGLYSMALVDGQPKSYDGNEIATGDVDAGGKGEVEYVPTCPEHFKRGKRTSDFNRHTLGEIVTPELPVWLRK